MEPENVRRKSCSLLLSQDKQAPETETACRRGLFPKKRCDIIIVNYNSTDHVINCIKSMVSHMKICDVNIIIADNNSDDSPERIKQAFEDVWLIKNSENIGFSRANNKAISLCQSPYLIVLNPDTLVTEKFFDNIINFIKKNQNIGIIGPKIYDRDQSIQGSARSFPTLLTSLFGRRSPLTKIYPNNTITKKNLLNIHYNGAGPLEVDWVSGACMAMRRNVIKEVGCFDENFFLYWEDADLCKRVKEAGWRIAYYPGAEIIHFTGKSSDTTPYFAIYHFHKSCYYLYRKHSNGFRKMFTPLVFFGLTLRGLLTMLLNFISRDIP